MTITFFSSVLNHHQISLCNALRQIPGVVFTFVQMIELTEERRAQGFSAIEESFVVSARQEPEKAYRLCMESDVVIAGVIDQKWVNQRVAKGKLTFAYKERFCKDLKVMFHPAFWKNGYMNYFRYRNQQLYLLCASAYTAPDTKHIFPRPEKKFKWGYFPQVAIHADAAAHLEGKSPASILWAGRFISLKHPEMCVRLAKHLKETGYTFTMRIVGLGPMEQELKDQIARCGLQDSVKLLGQMPPQEVRREMGKSEIFLFTSDHKEGWGAVLNEAMSEGCACICSRQAGSTGFLIKNGENGFCYNWDDINTLIQCTEQLLENRILLRNIQTNAMETIRNAWNAETAATRFAAFCQARLEGNVPQQYDFGPMSRV